MKIRIHKVVALVLGGCFVACSGAGPGAVQSLGDGQYRLECDEPLHECLAKAEARCRGRGYVLTEGREERRRVGVVPVNSEYIDSRAVFVCGDKAVKTQTGPVLERPSSAPAPAATTPACLPGASQACVGPGGCTGGQVCLPDGRSFSPCDCGPPPSAEPQSVTPESQSTPSPSATAPAPQATAPAASATSAPLAPAETNRDQ